jgi:hypothetical protein
MTKPGLLKGNKCSTVKTVNTMSAKDQKDQD